jgi:hypothetical protein
MNFEIEKKISNFVESQFPQFYLTEGPDFILFVKAYYEWLESEGQAVRQARTLLDYRDIDNTLDAFLQHFQTKYLYGIPFSIIVNPRYLLKHILDVYRSKGTIQCYKLLFKLIYNQDVDVYLPGYDVLKPSDNTWSIPQYIEITNAPNLTSFIGQTVVGLSSGTTAVVENYTTEPVNYNIISSFYLSNIQPQGGNFNVGEKVIIQGQQSNSAAVLNAPSVIGSLNSINIVNGGQNFNVGDILKIVHRDLSNNAVVSKGVNGLVRVSSIGRGQGSLFFNITDGGSGYTDNPLTFVYNGPGDTTGQGASFSVSALSSIQNYTYNTDLIADYLSKAINSSQYNFPLNPTGNSSSTLTSTLKYNSGNFGAVASLSNIKTGNNYTKNANVFVRSVITSNLITGTITYNTASSNVTFGSANAQYYLNANDTIALQANSAVTGSIEYAIIKSVTNSSSIVLYGKPVNNSTPSASFRIAPTIFKSNFSYVSGSDATIYAPPAGSGNIVSTVTAVNSGKGYVDGEYLEMYLSGGLASISVLNGGQNYSNGDSLIFVGGGTFVSYAKGFVTVGSSVALTIDPSSTTAGTYLPGHYVYQNVSSSSNTANGSIFSVNSSLMIVNVNSGTFTSSALVYDNNVSGLHSNVTSLAYTNGIITSATLTSNGSGYDSSPMIYIKSANGIGATLSAAVSAYNTVSQVTGYAMKTGIGSAPGSWLTTQSFLNSNKYIQDSYFYQDFSYQIKTASTLDKYKDILYNTFHVAGSELFGQFQLSEKNKELAVIKFEESTMEINNVVAYYLTADSTTIHADNSINTADQLFVSI